MAIVIDIPTSDRSSDRWPALDVTRIREDFPILHEPVNGRRLVYLDNAATTQKPRQVIEALVRYYTLQNANIHRGVHHLSQVATDEYEKTRARIREFINAPEECEVIFVRGATEGINLVASSFGRSNLKQGDEVIISTMEHHSNIVPWQLVCEAMGAKLRVIPINDDGELDIEEFKKMLNPRVKIVAVTQVSNALGTVNPIKEIVEIAHSHNVPVLVDAAQSIPHMPVDVQDLGCDFLAFSGHKMYGPTGIGVLWGKRELLEKMPPYQGGGDMISYVTFDKTLYNELPYKFEAGTPNIADVIALRAAIDYLEDIGMEAIEAYERELLQYAIRQLSRIPDIRFIGNAKNRAGVVSFLIGRIHPHDIGTILDSQGIAVRAGHHCAQPVMDRFGVPATARASFAFYNTKEEIDALVKGVKKVIEVFA